MRDLDISTNCRDIIAVKIKLENYNFMKLDEEYYYRPDFMKLITEQILEFMKLKTEQILDKCNLPLPDLLQTAAASRTYK